MYKKGFFIEEAVGNNAFSWEKRKNKKLWVPSLIEIKKLDEIKLQDDLEKIAFEDFDFDSNLSSNYGLKNFYKLDFKEKEIYIFDNHNHAFYFWFLAKSKEKIGDNNFLIHIDEHSDMRDNKKFLDKNDENDLQKIFEFTNFTLNVGDYIVPAIKNGIISEVLQIRNTKNLEDYLKNFYKKEFSDKNFILNLDLDFFEPNLDFIDFELKKKVVLDAFNKAKVVTICTSPFFIEQNLALDSLKKIFNKIL